MEGREKREGNKRGKKEKRADLKEGTGRACSVCSVWKENQLEEVGRERRGGTWRAKKHVQDFNLGLNPHNFATLVSFFLP